MRQLGEQLGEGGVLKNEEGEDIIDIREDIAEEYSDEFGGNNKSNFNTTNNGLLPSSDDEFEDLMQEMEELELEEEEEEEEEHANTAISSKYTEKQPSKIYNGLKRGFLLPGSGITTASLYENTKDIPIDKPTKPPIKPTSMAKQQAAAFTGHVVERINSSNEGTVPAVPSSSKPVSKFKQRMGR